MTFERQKMNKRVLRDLKKRSTIGLLFYIVLTLIIVFADNFHERHLILSICFVLSIWSICLFRLVHLVISRKMGERCEKLNKNIFFASVILTGLIWGVTYALVMIQKGEYTAQFLMSLCVCGLCAGGVVAFLPNRRLSIFFDISMLMPVIIIMLVNGLNIPLIIMIF
jgi:protein-S-isoprenylcysteine O-methyltransferase Ste14